MEYEHLFLTAYAGKNTSNTVLHGGCRHDFIVILVMAVGIVISLLSLLPRLLTL